MLTFDFFTARSNLLPYAFVWTIYTERKKKHRVNFIPKFHSSLKKFVKYFTMIKNGTCMEQKFQISLVCDQQVSSY